MAAPNLGDVNLNLIERAGGAVLAFLAVAFAFTAPAMADDSYPYGDPRSAILHRPQDISAIPEGFLLATIGSVQRYQPRKSLKRVAGGGRRPITLDPIPATEAGIFGTYSVNADPSGGFVLTFGATEQIDRVSPDGNIVRVAGGRFGSGGDGGPVTSAALRFASDAAPTADGGLLIADSGNDRIRAVSPGGTISTVAGGGPLDSEIRDGATATDVHIPGPRIVIPLPDGGFAFLAGRREAVYEVRPDGVLQTLAGTGEPGFSGDGGPATEARLQLVSDIAVDAEGRLLIADAGNARVRRVAANGTISTVAGNGSRPYEANGVPATETTAQVNGISATADGGFLVLGDGRVRKVSPSGILETLAGIPAPSDCKDQPYSGRQGTIADESLAGGKPRDLIRGEAGDDEIAAGRAADCIDAGFDDDTVDAGSGRDVVDAGNGADEVLGEGGADLIYGSNGEDSLDGDGGRDTLYGGADADRTDGGRGRDRIFDGSGGDLVIGGRGNDTIDVASRFAGPDRVRCGPGRDVVKANSNDRVDRRSCEKIKGQRDGD